MSELLLPGPRAEENNAPMLLELLGKIPPAPVPEAPEAVPSRGLHRRRIASPHSANSRSYWRSEC